MNELLIALKYLHFLRPWWLLAALVVIISWWRIRRRLTNVEEKPSGLAAHLAKAMTVGKKNKQRFLAIDGIAITLVLIALSVSGPTWHRVPNPLVSQTAPLAVAFAQNDSMTTPDPLPSRLERAKFKLLDLLKGRAGARTSLIAYAGSAHRVIPLTEDPQVLKPFIEGLSPQIMPVKGVNAAQALDVALASLADEANSGAILFILDQFSEADVPAFNTLADNNGPPVVFYAIGASPTSLSALNDVDNATIVSLTADNSDVVAIDRRVALAYQDAMTRDERLQWDDKGWLLAWPALLLTLLYFRRGWTLRWQLSWFLVIALHYPSPAQAEGWVDWFLTPDQQGQLAFDSLDWGKASTLFQDPHWRGYALYSNGQYEQAASQYAQMAGADAAFAQGVSLIKARKYSEAIQAFETAIKEDPEHTRAQRNLTVAKAILAYVEYARETQDTGTGSEGADETVFDKQSDQGFEMEVQKDKPATMQTAEQWMRTVDTRAGQFLKLRFQLESAGQQ